MIYFIALWQLPKKREFSLSTRLYHKANRYFFIGEQINLESLLKVTFLLFRYVLLTLKTNKTIALLLYLFIKSKKPSRFRYPISIKLLLLFNANNSTHLILFSRCSLFAVSLSLSLSLSLF